MATIASLAVSLVAKTNNFLTGISKSNKAVNRFARDLKKHTKTVAKYGLALTTAAAIAASALVSQQLKVIDATAKTADKLGIATDRLEGLRFAAEQTGNTTRNLELGIQRMTRRVAEAAQGTGEAKGAIKELGLDAQRLIRLSPDRQFAKIADAMESIQSQADRVRLGFKLFDAEGVALINTLRGGSDQLEKFQTDAERLGRTFTRIDAAQVEAANDSFNRLRSVVTGVFKVLAIRLAPIITTATSKITAMATESESLADIVSNGFDRMIRLIARLTDFINLAQSAWFTFVAGVTGSATVLLQPMRLLLMQLQRVIDTINRFSGLNLPNVSGFAEDLSSNLAGATQKAARKASESFNSFLTKENSKAADAFLADVRVQAERVAKNVSGAITPDVITGAGSTGDGEFLNRNIARLAIGGIQSTNKKNTVSDPESHSLLERIAKNTKPQGPVAAVAV